MATFTADRLRTGLETLPQELYDNMYNFVFVPPENHNTTINKAYKPPVQLQINKETRAAFSALYYGNGSTWTFRDWDSGIVILKKWLQSRRWDTDNPISSSPTGEGGNGSFEYVLQDQGLYPWATALVARLPEGEKWTKKTKTTVVGLEILYDY